uniref:rRNA methyltransferase 1, mitochondrial n=1 Tax=Equus asinus TaxID=9793 RepID=A0A9L0KBL0_EQUAS
MALLWTWRCSGRLLTRHFSGAARRGVRPGGEELSRLRLDDLAPTLRSETGLELLFGLSPCLLALQAARRRVARLLLQAGRSGLQGERAELLRAAEARDIPVLRPRRKQLDALCHYQVHQGVCMEVKARQGWLVAGTVGCPGPETSLSSEMPITSCLEFVWDQPTLLVLGNEGSGLSQEVQASCQVLLTILPGRQLPPGLESLNVSVATGILLHSICSQRKAFPAEQKRGKLLQDPQEPPATSEGPRVAQQPGLSSGSEKERHDGG